MNWFGTWKFRFKLEQTKSEMRDIITEMISVISRLECRESNSREIKWELDCFFVFCFVCTLYPQASTHSYIQTCTASQTFYFHGKFKPSRTKTVATKGWGNFVNQPTVGWTNVCYNRTVISVFHHPLLLCTDWGYLLCHRWSLAHRWLISPMNSHENGFSCH